MKQIRVGAALSYINIILKNVVYLVYTPLLINSVGQNSFGIYQLVTQVITTLSLFSMGFSGTYVHFYWTEKKKGCSYLKKLNGVYLKIFLLFTLVAVLFGVILVKFSSLLFSRTFSSGELVTARILMILLVFNVGITFISTVFDSFIAANEKFIFQQSRVLITTLAQPIIVIPLLICGMGVEIVAVVQLVLSIILLLMNMIYAIRKLGMAFSFSGHSNPLIKSLFIFSSFLFLNDVVDLINNNLPGIIVGTLLGPASVAIYAIVIQIRSIFFQISLALSSIFIPKVNQMAAEGKSSHEFTDLLISVGRLQLTLLMLVYGGFVTVGQYFLNIWAGEGFKKAYLMIVIVLLPALIPLSQNVGIEIQRAKNLHKFRSIILTVFSLLNLILTFYGIKLWGVQGATIGYIVSLSVGNGIIINIYNHFIVKLDMVKFWKSMFNILIVSCFSIAVGIFLQKIIIINTFYKFILIGGVYVLIFCVLWYFLAANSDEKKNIKKMILKVKK